MAPHLDLNSTYKDKGKGKDKDKDEDEDEDEKDNYIKLIESHLKKKGQKRYWSNISRKSDTNNDLI
jgi:hypothetical protein